MKLKPNIAISESGFLFDPSTGESFNLNKTGNFILKLLVEGKSEQDLALEVAKKYDIQDQVFQRYLDDFRVMLHQFNLLEKEEL